MAQEIKVLLQCILSILNSCMMQAYVPLEHFVFEYTI